MAEVILSSSTPQQKSKSGHMIIVEKGGKAWFRGDSVSGTIQPLIEEVLDENTLPPDVASLLKAQSKPAKKPPKMRAAAKADSAPANLIFFQASQVTDDPFWKDIFKRMSRNVYRKGFRFFPFSKASTPPTASFSSDILQKETTTPTTLLPVSSTPNEVDVSSTLTFGNLPNVYAGRMVYRTKTKEHVCNVPLDPEQAFEVVKSFMSHHTGLISDMDQSHFDKLIIDFTSDPFQALPKKWSEVKGSTSRSMLISHFSEHAKRRCGLTDSEAKDFISTINLAVASGLFNEKNIHLKNGAIEKIDGLCRDYETGEFYISFSANDLQKNGNEILKSTSKRLQQQKCETAVEDKNSENKTNKNSCKENETAETVSFGDIVAPKKRGRKKIVTFGEEGNEITNLKSDNKNSSTTRQRTTTLQKNLDTPSHIFSSILDSVENKFLQDFHHSRIITTSDSYSKSFSEQKMFSYSSSSDDDEEQPFKLKSKKDCEESFLTNFVSSTSSVSKRFPSTDELSSTIDAYSTNMISVCISPIVSATYGFVNSLQKQNKIVSNLKEEASSSSSPTPQEKIKFGIDNSILFAEKIVYPKYLPFISMSEGVRKLFDALIIQNTFNPFFNLLTTSFEKEVFSTIPPLESSKMSKIDISSPQSLLVLPLEFSQETFPFGERGGTKDTDDVRSVVSSSVFSTSSKVKDVRIKSERHFFLVKIVTEMLNCINNVTINTNDDIDVTDTVSKFASNIDLKTEKRIETLLYTACDKLFKSKRVIIDSVIDSISSENNCSWTIPESPSVSLGGSAAKSDGAVKRWHRLVDTLGAKSSSRRNNL